MKKHEIFFGVIKIPLEFLIFFMSFFLAKEIRGVTDLIPGVQLPIQTIDAEKLIIFALVGAGLYIGMFIFHGLYQIGFRSSRVKEVLDICLYGLYWFWMYIGILYLSHGFIYETEIPRLIILFTLILGTLGVILERSILHMIQFQAIRTNMFSKTSLVLIMNTPHPEILENITRAGIYRIIGYANPCSSPDMEVLHIPYVGAVQELQHIFKNHQAEELISIHSDFSFQEQETIFEYARIYGIRYRYAPNMFEAAKSNTQISLLARIPLMEIKNIGLGPWGRILKRTTDVFASFFGLIVLFPFFIVFALLIKIEDSGGPVFYKNRRIGKNGKIFNIYKFRYMYWKYCIKDSYGINHEKDKAIQIEQKLIQEHNIREGPLYKIKNDPRKTKIGSFLEKYSLDELPQLLNVLRGDMSLVGPRPHQPREVIQYKEHQKRVLTIKPGITGMAQVNGRHKNSFEDEVRLDIFYIENWSLLLDLKIFFKTIGVVLGRK